MKTDSALADKKQDIVAVLRSHGAVVGYLFGSHARGKAGRRSDFDVGVVFPYSMASEMQGARIEDIRSDLERIFGRDRVDVVNVGSLTNPLIRYIITLGEGIILFADNIELKNSIAHRALRDFEDTRHLRNIQKQALERLFI